MAFSSKFWPIMHKKKRHTHLHTVTLNGYHKGVGEEGGTFEGIFSDNTLMKRKMRVKNRGESEPEEKVLDLWITHTHTHTVSSWNL